MKDLPLVEQQLAHWQKEPETMAVQQPVVEFAVSGLAVPGRLTLLAPMRDGISYPEVFVPELLP